MTLFDPGLQPERTQLAWQRTALSIAVGSIVALRALPAILGSAVWFVPGIAGVCFAAWMWVASRRRYAPFVMADAEAKPDAAPRAPGAALLLVLACFVVAVGVVAVVVIVDHGF